MVPGGRLARCEQVETRGVVDGDPRCDHRDDDHEADQHEAEARLRILEEQREPAGDAAVLRGRSDDEGDGFGLCDRLELRHQLALTRGSSTKLSRSMMKLAAITANAKTSSKPWVS